MYPAIILQITQGAMSDSTVAASPVVTPTAAPATMPHTVTLFEFLLKGGPIMIPIAILSVVTVFIFIERYVTIKKASKIDRNFMNHIHDMIYNGNIESARLLCRNTNSPIARMIEKGISRIGKPIKEIEGAIENVGKIEINKLEKNLAILGVIAGIAPMFGFVGTIVGVIKIFYNISLSDNISIGLISGGLYEKMITSASGLVIGIVAYVAYHYLAIMLDKVIFKIESNAIEFIDMLQEPSK